ncbi:MAG: GMC family oxidoreductase, partial [Alphaproteobacteria bacterium]
ATQYLGSIQNIGRHYDTESCRLRYFGGSTNHWGGHCVPLQPIDFETRDWIPESGWPVSFDELKPYYERAHALIELGEDNYDPQAVANELGYKLFPFTGDKVVTTLSRYHPQRFGSRYATEIDDAPNINIYLYATVVSIDLDDSLRRATHVTAKTLAGNTIRFRAQQFVVATGGIENARLLLDSNQQVTSGLGNEHDLVGRYFQDHIWYPRSYILPASFDPSHAIYAMHMDYRQTPQVQIRCHLARSQNATRALRVPRYRAELATISSVLDSMTRVNSSNFTALDVMSLLGHPKAVWDYVSSGIGPELDAYLLNNYVEQVPNRDSRITLSGDRNALGQRLARLDWRLSEIDRRGVRTAQNIIAQEVGRHHFGRLRNLLPADDEESIILENAGWGCHHIGTTRMHDDPKRGVVERNCRMHACENIYVAGSSVFPCSGWANPTLTIVALALRLADHLNDRVFHHG